jgi:hypothetical protein
MNNIKEFLGCGSVTKGYKSVHRYRVTKISHLTNQIVPLLKKYGILGEKSKDFDDFCKVVEMVKVKKHLTKEGLDEIRIIKAGMNTGR